MAYTAKKYGCDISENNPDSDWMSWVNSSRFCIIRAGYTGSAYETLETDANFERNYSYCKSKAVPMGAYYWTRANTATKAQQEADYFYNLCAGKILPYGLWVDMEDAVIQTSNYLTVANAFCARLRSRGFTGIVGVYASAWRFRSGGGLENMTQYYRWVADWHANDGTLTPTTVPNCYMQQYTTHMGPNNHLDTNAVFGTAPGGGDDPIPPSPGGGTGKKNSSTPSSGTKKNKTLDEYVWDVVKGKYGNGEVRKKKLGSLYNKVQDRLNYLWDLSTKVIRGDYGNGKRREQMLGANYDIVQKIVNHRLGVK